LLCHVAQTRNDVVHATRQRFNPGSPFCSVARPDRDVLRGGALEPGARHACVRARTFLSQAGPQVRSDVFQAEHHLPLLLIRLRNDKGDPVGSPSLEQLCR
jgi:hypothetical protein